MNERVFFFFFASFFSSFSFLTSGDPVKEDEREEGEKRDEETDGRSAKKKGENDRRFLMVDGVYVCVCSCVVRGESLGTT